MRIQHDRIESNFVTSKTKTYGLIFAAIAAVCLITFGMYAVGKEASRDSSVTIEEVPGNTSKLAVDSTKFQPAVISTTFKEAEEVADAVKKVEEVMKKAKGPENEIEPEQNFKAVTMAEKAKEMAEQAELAEKAVDVVEVVEVVKEQELKTVDINSQTKTLKKKEKNRSAVKNHVEPSTSRFASPIIPNDTKFVGIANVGNSCFANSIFQVLYHTPTFRSAIQKYIDESALGQQDDHPQIKGLHRIFEALSGAQNYSHVSLSYDWIRAALSKELVPKRTDDSGILLNFYASIPGLNWNSLNLYEVATTEIEYSDRDEKSVSISYSCILGLVLDFPTNEENVTMLSLLDHHYSPQTIEPNPVVKESAKTKQLKLSGDGLPDSYSFTIQLMRFYTGPDGKDCKNNSKITVDEVIDLQKYSTEPDLLAKPYHLVGFIKHLGSGLNSPGAHYYAIVRGPKDTWIKLNDSGVSVITRAAMLKEAEDGYIFVYHKY